MRTANNCKLVLRFSFFFISLFIFNASIAQIIVNPNQTAAALASKLAGAGVTIISPTLTCATQANGFFVSRSTPLTIDSGILLTSGRATDAAGMEPFLASTNNGTAGDAALTAIVGAATHDACVLQFDFTTTGDSVKFEYQFGSEEYNHSTCGQYNDPFGFFISGPGITGVQNIALVPGTSVPVAVNSVNSGIPGPLSLCSTCNIANCTAMGVGSPFTAYYYDNTGGTQLTYKGFAERFAAVHSVIPCNTYHMKIAIADVSNSLYDSGVFLKAGSLKTNAFSFDRSDSIGATVNSVPHTIVKGCDAATLTINSAYSSATAQTILLGFGGTAVNGYDVNTVAGSVVIPADSTSASFMVQGIPTLPAGTKTFTIYLLTACGIADSVTINVLDTPTARILTPDTAICRGGTFQIMVAGSAGLTYSWAPGTWLAGTAVMEPFASPLADITYSMAATLPGTGCPPINRSIHVTVDTVAVSMLSQDTGICFGQSVSLRISGSDSLSYTWTPPTGLNSNTIENPVATPSVTTTYTVTATSRMGCGATDTVTVTIANLAVSLFNPDTAICLGGSVQIRAVGGAGTRFQWIPTAGIALSNVLSPIIFPDTSATYYLLSTVPGCSEYADSIKIDVQPNPRVYIGGARQVCEFDTLHLSAFVAPAWYPRYIFTWTPSGILDDTMASAVVFKSNNSASVHLTVETPAGCRSADSANIIVRPGNFASLGPDTTLCPGDSIQLIPAGGVTYRWHPGTYMSDSAASMPWVHPITNLKYTMVATSIYGCKDTLGIHLSVLPAAVIYLGDSVILYPGQSYRIPTQTNCTSFSWFPAAGLDNVRLSAPTATPELSTKYMVLATTQTGCSVVDSIDIYIDPSTLLALPNAFTPGNGTNNLFKIIKQGEAVLNYFRIYNRWGNMVFESTNIDEGWDGAYKGIPQPTGVFVYELEAISNTGQVFKKHGNVTLLR